VTTSSPSSCSPADHGGRLHAARPVTRRHRQPRRRFLQALITGLATHSARAGRRYALCRHARLPPAPAQLTRCCRAPLRRRRVHRDPMAVSAPRFSSSGRCAGPRANPPRAVVGRDAVL
jgi:hypothetical protein